MIGNATLHAKRHMDNKSLLIVHGARDVLPVLCARSLVVDCVVVLISAGCYSAVINFRV